MSEETVVCPSCGFEFPLSEALTANIEKRIRFDIEKTAHDRETELTEKYNEALRVATQKAYAKAKEGLALELTDIQAQLKEKTEQLDASQKRELILRKKERELDERIKTADLDIERRLGEERDKLEKTIGARLSEDHRLVDLKKDKQLRDLQDQIEELKRRATQGSQQAQGEIAELDFESLLSSQFPYDKISPVPKGVRGVDVVQRIVDLGGRTCGNIAWEVKNTKKWSNSWLSKLRDDQRDLKADVAVLVSAVLPKDIKHFAYSEGVWVSDTESALGLASALRSGLIQVAQARTASEGQGTKMGLLYDYLTGTEFRQRVESVVEAFISMKDDLDRERRSVEALWAKRDKQIARAFGGLAGMYGDMQGIVGTPLPRVEQLEISSSEMHEEEESLPF